MVRDLLLCIAVFFTVTACKDVKPSSDEVVDVETDTVSVSEDEAEELEELISEEAMPVAAEELFDDFLFNFASNRKLQMERINFPLTVTSATKTDTLERNEWQMDHFFMSREEYSLIFDSEHQMVMVKDTTVTHVVVERIFLEQGFVCQYLFDRKDGKWMLNSMNRQTMSLNHNGSFLSFYRRFATDSLFRQNSLSEEVQFTGPDPDNEMEQMEGVITPDFWEAFAPDLPHDTIYNIVYGENTEETGVKVFVLRGIANGSEVEMTFHRYRENWKLVKLSE